MEVRGRVETPKRPRLKIRLQAQRRRGFFAKWIRLRDRETLEARRHLKVTVTHLRGRFALTEVRWGSRSRSAMPSGKRYTSPWAAHGGPVPVPPIRGLDTRFCNRVTLLAEGFSVSHETLTLPLRIPHFLLELACFR